MPKVDPSLVVVSNQGLRKLAQAGRESVPEIVTPGEAPLLDEEKLRMRAGLDAALSRLEDEEEKQERAPGVMVAPNHAPTALLQSFLAERAAETGMVEPTPQGAYEAKFDERDLLGWAGSLFSWWRKYLKKHEWLAAPNTPQPIPQGTRIAIMGDWGTGLYGAPACSRSIERAQPAPHVVLHLGDVYYSGTEKEIDERFLKFLPQVPNVTLRALNSNHEMYSGGYGYFDKTLRAFRQDASCFALENERWLLVGLDTGYDDHALHGDQADWLSRLMALAQAKGQKVILFSHHQPYSHFEAGGSKLLQALRPWLESRRIFAWYWGHEHRCVLFSPHEAWGLHGRCIGHSGFPYFRDRLGHLPVHQKDPGGSSWYRLAGKGNVPEALVLDGPNVYLPGEEERYGPHGYVSFELGEQSLFETVHAADGTPLLRQELS